MTFYSSLSVEGCPGAGKTLIMMQMAREFLEKRGTSDKVGLFLPAVNTMLIEQLKDQLEGETRAKVVGYRYEQSRLQRLGTWFFGAAQQ